MGRDSPKQVEIQALVELSTLSASLGPFWMMLRGGRCQGSVMCQTWCRREEARAGSASAAVSGAACRPAWKSERSQRATLRRWHSLLAAPPALDSLEAADPDGEEGEEGQHPQGQHIAVLAAQHCGWRSGQCTGRGWA